MDSIVLKEKNWMQLMAEGGDAGGEAAAEAAETAEPEAEAAAPDLEAEFGDLVKRGGKYHDAYGKMMQKAVAQRLKGSNAKVERLNSFGPAFEVLAARYGMRADDPGLADAIAKDAALLDEVALKNNRDSQTELAIRQAQAQTAQAEALIQRMLADQDMARWQQEAAELQAEYPDFDLNEEMANPDFLNLIKNNVTMKGAYMALHHDDVIQRTVRKTEKKVTDTVAAGKARPRENGTGSTAGATLGKNPMDMSSAEFREAMKRVERGERLDFST